MALTGAEKRERVAMCVCLYPYMYVCVVWVQARLGTNVLVIVSGSYSQPHTSSLFFRVLEELSLTRCADQRIGNVDFRGISGGERKRTSIAYELLVRGFGLGGLNRRPNPCACVRVRS